MLTSFIASAAFGLIFNVPKRTLPHCGAVGMAGWLVYTIGMRLSAGAIAATLIAAVTVTVISQLFAKQYKTPIIVFSVAGIIPLVPGGLAYDAMRNVVVDNYGLAVQFAVKAFMISGAIAIGLVFSEVINRIIRGSGKHAAHRHAGRTDRR
ncbi:threonine/serine exporter family protein [Paenibacillus arenilitoris]|uniref:Threonine/serine exporter family protein n=1 Tax=Paenibacillus arenilitoris TaxID=2772299 RepID=A0A927H9F9_9BACL|nr:threonine/serine exporter family protein [Paenibacillus arenilitoris]MBD2871564.1 threonine/serine exporter family protein [Paenibacillus arenilitoris]